MRAFFLLGCGVGLACLLGIRGRAASVSPDGGEIAIVLPLADEGAGTGENEKEGDWDHLIEWLGHFHPALTVFPIAMLLGAALAELLVVLGGGAWLEGASRWCVIVGALGGMVTAPLGWAFAMEHEKSWMLEWHRWLGTAAGGGALVILILSEVGRRTRGGALTLFRLVLFLAVPLVIATGFLGGAMVYGIHEFDWNVGRHEHGSGGESLGTQNAGEKAAATESGVAEVTMGEDSFKPVSVTIAVGGKVRWRNTSKKDTHTVTNDPKVASDAKDVSMPEGAKAFNSGKIKPGGTFEQTFTIAGTYKYICEPHEEMGMKGEVVVKGK